MEFLAKPAGWEPNWAGGPSLCAILSQASMKRSHRSRRHSSPVGGRWPDWYKAQLWTIPTDLSSPTRISPQFVVRNWCYGFAWCADWEKEYDPYHEFMNVAPAGVFPDPQPRILFSVVWKKDLPVGASDGLDLWAMRPDGSGRHRITSFNATRYANVLGGMAFDGDRIIVGVTGDANANSIDAYSVTP